MIKTKKYIYLLLFIITLVIVGFGIIILNPNVISILLSFGYISFFFATKTTNYFSKDLFIIRYEKSFFLLILLIVAIIQFTIKDQLRNIPLILMGFLFLVISYIIFSWIHEKIKIIRELKNERLHSTILKLSEMMRYTIYDGKKEIVNLEEEINFLKNYIDLHTIRHFNKIDVKFEFSNEQPDQKITPLLLINLLENAFKHGAEKLEKEAFIHINISTKSNILNFVIENNFEDQESSKGIGLDNLKRRLQLLYPNNHDFNTSTHNNIFRAELSLYLNQ